MGLGNAKASRRSAAWRFFTHTFSLGSLLVLAFMFLPSTAAAQTTSPFNIANCGVNIPITGDGSSYTVTGQITASTTNAPCITIDGSGVTLNMTGGIINMVSAGHGAVAISVSPNATLVTIENGTIYTDYTTSLNNTYAAIEASQTSELDINGVNIQNGAAPPATPTTNPECASVERTLVNYGTGIFLNNVTGATISGNYAFCYQYGIYVQGSAVPSSGQGAISGNTLVNDAYTMSLGTPGTKSAGLVLDGSSGWTVNTNTVNYNGSPDASLTCIDLSTGQSVSCSFGLQVIGTSSGNIISMNTVGHDFTGGIYAGPDVSQNSFTQNILDDEPFAGLFSSAPNKLRNKWSGNTCTNAPPGGNVPRKACG